VQGVAFGISTEEYQSRLVDRFTSGADFSLLYTDATIVEAAVVMCSMVRILMLASVNRHMFLVWKTVVGWCEYLVYFGIIFVPIFFGITSIAFASLGSWVSECRDFRSCMAANVMLSRSELDASTYFYSQRPWTLFHGFLLYVVVYVVMINAAVAVLFEVYQDVRVRCGYDPTVYNWKEYKYVQWSLWKPFAHVYFNFLRKGIDRGPVDDDDANDEDGQ